MPTADVTMPQMGESITEGTVTKWLKKVGERVGKDEPLFEISTDKVDAEIPSPASGTLARILVQEGQTVGVQTLVAQIESSEPVAAAPPEAPPQPNKAPPPKAEESSEEAGQIRSSPLVRRLAKDHHVDLADVEGTGPGGRITKEDLLAYVERGKTAPGAPAAARAPQPSALTTREEVVPMSVIRKKIAERMVLSRHTAAHVTTVFQVDLSNVVALYQRDKARFERQENAKLTYTPFFIRAVIDGLKRFPILNSSVSGENIVYKKDIHIGIAVALEAGLIVPVIPHADEKSFLGLARAVADLAERARTKKLSVSDVEGGTFTITNPGVYGGLFATPIINPPQVGIVGVGGIHKAPVVIDDAIAIRSLVHLALSFDHRLIDGAVADQFMASVRTYLEHWEEDLFA